LVHLFDRSIYRRVVKAFARGRHVSAYYQLARCYW